MGARPEPYSLLYLIPLLPLLGAGILTLLGAWLPRRLVAFVALVAAGGAFAASIGATWVFWRLGQIPLEAVLWEWIAVGRFRFDLVFGFDALTAALILVVTGVGFSIHVYSVGYMKDDPGFARYFAYLNLFVFAMSVLVLGRSLPVMFIGWEGVGLASYLLIGFWYADADKALAGKKAFVVNRIGDFGFLLGTLILLALFGTADFSALEAAAAGLSNLDTPLLSGLFVGYTPRAVITVACLALFLGACGKSAQIPLYVWLPDAMAGPTPVSALIHAATMVTAGVYLVVRLNFFFSPDVAPLACHVVAWIGAATAVLAATIGLAQNDIKRVLAYSTVSQLGYMFLAAGLGAYGAAIFHLVTHAFFKACLFLGSGAVIHALHGEQDMRRMGGLWRRLPTVFWTFFASTLALAGIAPFAGFFSKDAILAHAFAANPALWVLGFLGAGLTALYMGRLLGMTFFGEPRFVHAHGVVGHAQGAAAPAVDLAGHEPSAAAHGPSVVADSPRAAAHAPGVPADSASAAAHVPGVPARVDVVKEHKPLSHGADPGLVPSLPGPTHPGGAHAGSEHGAAEHPLHHPDFSMRLPLVVLGLLALVAGVLNLPHVFHFDGAQWLDHVLADVVGAPNQVLDAATEWLLMGVSVAWAAVWLLVGYAVYRRGPSKIAHRATSVGLGRWAHMLLHGKWFVDELYQFALVTPLRLFASFLAWIVDPFVIDGVAVKGSAFTVRSLGRVMSRVQTGNVQSYAAILVVATAVIILWAIR